MKEAALRVVEEELAFRAAVRVGVVQADRGELLDDEEMDARFAKMVQAGEAQLDRGEFLSHAAVGERLSRFLGR